MFLKICSILRIWLWNINAEYNAWYLRKCSKIFNPNGYAECVRCERIVKCEEMPEFDHTPHCKQCAELHRIIYYSRMNRNTNNELRPYRKRWRQM